MVACMDDGIGRILKSIDASGEAANTIVLFFSDNGGVGGLPRNNLPLRGNKLDAWEGGIRVAAAMRWPGGGVAGGKKITVPISCIDVMPTLTKLSGGTATLATNRSTVVTSSTCCRPSAANSIVNFIFTTARG